MVNVWVVVDILRLVPACGVELLDPMNMTWEEEVADMLRLVTAWVVEFIEGLEIPWLVTAWEKVDMVRLVTAWEEVRVDWLEQAAVCLVFELVVGWS